MTPLSNIISTARVARLKLLLGSALIFASMAAAGQAESLYPQPVPLGQTADVVRPEPRAFTKVKSRYPQPIQQEQSADVVRPSARADMNNCTQLELSAKMSPDECGTLTLNDVVKRLTAMRDADNSK
ncbi:hypothetical protein GQ651_14125 [Alphaproteobacteria bacterium GH1-50]|uniref:Uncharacterized protein n=1 Tax=Kangsaoukella pontilimi TaxID=2691042 RepID=A0A7C9J4U1_9RHOB|nr:hypothetical protein [Kangsaoukella pontilimi]MXQ08981.1 hypothetical protein [Kangsaoukella pontilimi]